MVNVTEQLTQDALNRTMREMGYTRHVSRNETMDARGAGADKASSLKATKGLLPLVRDNILTHIEALKADRAENPKCRMPEYFSYYTAMDVGNITRLAVIALKAAFNGVGARRDIRDISVSGGYQVQRDIEISGLLVSSPEVFCKALGIDPKTMKRKAGVEAAIDRYDTERSRDAYIRGLAEKEGCGWELWDSKRCARFFEPLLDAVLKTGMFEMYHPDEAFIDQPPCLELSEEGKALFDDLEGTLEFNRPWLLPMVETPEPWVSLNKGGYKDNLIARHTYLIRGHDKDAARLMKDAIADGSALPFLDALNGVQETGLAVNDEIRRWVLWAYLEGIELKKFPKKDGPKALPKLTEEQAAQMTPKDIAIYNGKRRALRSRARGISSEGLQFLSDMEVAAEFATVPAFYLPTTVDFRGRVYFQPSFNYQRADHIKALFQFAEAKPLGPNGLKWMKHQIASTGDFKWEAKGYAKMSKAALEDRGAWVDANHDALMSVAEDPANNRMWLKADKPFSFLAAVLEYRRYHLSGLGEAFLSALPVALDGSNSGLQHYSAALLSEEGRYVNLGDTKLPEDLYQAVADKVMAWVKADHAAYGPVEMTGDEFRELKATIKSQREEAKGKKGKKDAQEPTAEMNRLTGFLASRWLAYGVGRKEVKRNVMTFAYSSEEYGFKQQIIEDLMGDLSNKILDGGLQEHPFGSDHGHAAAGYLAKYVWRAVNEVVPQAGLAMKFLQACAGALAHEGKPMVWKTPLGFPVVNKYTDYDMETVELFLTDTKITVAEASSKDKIEGDSVRKRVKMNLRVQPKAEIKKEKQKSSVAPNCIHSMDATHLLKTVALSKARGIHDFMLIHDSFATHAGHTEEFFYIIREAFVDMYESFNLFSYIHETVKASLSPEGIERLEADKNGSVPQRGSLNLKTVLSSRYCFA